PPPPPRSPIAATSNVTSNGLTAPPVPPPPSRLPFAANHVASSSKMSPSNVGVRLRLPPLPKVAAPIPIAILDMAHQFAVRTGVHGSATACVVTVENGCLQAVNVGDAGFMVVRPRVGINGDRQPEI